MKWENINQLCDIVREASFSIHTYHRNGHLEKVYENALVNRLRKLGLDVQQSFPLTVYDEDGTILGEYYADLFIEQCLIVELKHAKRWLMSTWRRFWAILNLPKLRQVY